MTTSALAEYDKEIREAGLKCIAGIDEAGRGPLAGPVVAACVIADPEWLVEGVNDSKRLSEIKREKLYELILKQSIAVGVGIVDAEEIDQINIRQATHKAMCRAVKEIRNIFPDILLIDGTDTLPLEYEQRAVVQGDGTSYSVAAASIVAKVTRDRLMRDYDTLYPGYGFALHKGYGTKLHTEAVLEKGPAPIHRKTFLTKIIDRGSWSK